MTTTPLFRVRLSAIFDVGASAPVAGSEPPPPVASEVATRWLDLADRLCEEDQRAARAIAVQRARRIWGRLGNLLRRSAWCQAWRAEHLVSCYVYRFVRVWRHGYSSRPRR